MILREAEPVHRSGAHTNPSVTASMLLRFPRAGTFVVEPQWAGILIASSSTATSSSSRFHKPSTLTFDAGRFGSRTLLTDALDCAAGSKRRAPLLKLRRLRGPGTRRRYGSPASVAADCGRCDHGPLAAERHDIRQLSAPWRLLQSRSRLLAL